MANSFTTFEALMAGEALKDAIAKGYNVEVEWEEFTSVYVDEDNDSADLVLPKLTLTPSAPPPPPRPVGEARQMEKNLKPKGSTKWILSGLLIAVFGWTVGLVTYIRPDITMTTLRFFGL
jgi:hypothetical protein